MSKVDSAQLSFEFKSSAVWLLGPTNLRLHEGMPASTGALNHLETHSRVCGLKRVKLENTRPREVYSSPRSPLTSSHVKWGHLQLEGSQQAHPSMNQHRHHHQQVEHSVGI